MADLRLESSCAAALTLPRPIAWIAGLTEWEEGEVGAFRSGRRSAGGELGRRDERRLIRAAGNGSPEAIERLFEAFWPRTYRAAFLITHDAHAAEDIAQEAFLAAIRRLETFDRRRPFGPWLHRIAINRAIDWSRASKLRPRLAEELLDGLGETDPRIDADEDPRAAAVGPALDALTPEQRAIVAMRFVLDLTPGEIASELGLPRGTVNSRLRRALDRLASELGA
jgi:RNA polymerase sigma-70 factor (ECF subfamily)